MATKTNLHINDADQLIQQGEFLLDVRETIEYEIGHIGRTKNIPLPDLTHRLTELPKDRKIFVYCQRGKRSLSAVEILNEHGFNAVSLTGGYTEYTGELQQEGALIPIDPNRKKVQASGLQCPGPLLKVAEAIEEIAVGEQVEITVTDFGFCTDIEAWAKKTGHTVVKNEPLANKIVVILQKNPNQAAQKLVETKDGATMVVFSGDLDKALASFIIASGARSMGKEVTMFFTFWGLNIIKDPKAMKRKKTGLDKLFSKMMPKSAEKLPISKMNMFGLGSKMIQRVMRNKKVDALTDMIQKANDLGIKMIACTMSMDLMAIERSELFSFIDIGGVGTYLGDAENGNLNLFI